VDAPPDKIRRILGRIRRRITMAIFVENSARAMLAASGALLVGVLLRTLMHHRPWDTRLAAAMAFSAVIVALVATWLQRPSLTQAAATMDRLADTRDRFVTGLEFAAAPSRPPLHGLALEECARFVDECAWRKFVRVRLSRRLAYLLVPATAICLLVWNARLAQPVQSAEAKQELAGHAREIDALAQQTAAAASELKSEELSKIAEEMRKSAARLKAEESDDAARAPLRELSTLEEMVRAMQGSGASGDLAALQEALQQDPRTADAAKDIKSGDLENAADKLDKLANMDEAALEQLAQAVQKALSERAAASKEQKAGITQQALKNLAAALRRMSGTRRAQPGKAGDAVSQALQNLLGELQELKHAMQQGRADRYSGQNAGGGQLLISSPQGAVQKPEPQLVLGAPSGQPGSESDVGTTDTPFGAQQKRSAEKGTATQLTGVMGEGESLRDFMPAAGDDSKSTQRYREIYSAMAPAAEDALRQEEIPIGSRFFVKRYFQYIRPKE
jgi:hypothetical protein